MFLALAIICMILSSLFLVFFLEKLKSEELSFKQGSMLIIAFVVLIILFGFFIGKCFS